MTKSGIPGTRQFSNTSSEVFDPLMPSLSSFCAVENPSNDFSTKKAVIPLDGFMDKSVLA